MPDLDYEKFRKVDALTRSPHDAEARAAEAKATEMAERAGLTLTEARAAASGKPFGLISFDMNELFAFEEAPNREQPRYRSGWTARRAHTYAELLQARASVGARYDSFEAVLEPTERERRLEAVCGLFAEKLEVFTAAGPEVDAPQQLLDAAIDAYPLPGSLSSAWAEYEEWGQLDADRWAIMADERTFRAPDPLTVPAAIRIRVLAGLLEGKLHASTLTDLLIRLHYFAQINSRGGRFDNNDADGLLRSMLRDIAAMVPSGMPKPVPSAPPVTDGLPLRTATERRRFVQAMLADPANADLSAREIGRRAGVSPQTVLNIRARLMGEQPRSEGPD